ncbi:DUF1338-domain-containing protein [Cryphonectria parasitica EP155]|uniref:2-oxoadipate dioxygenase/decarboxylase n=1 Tax=Cryphonectria parasitica (strain ATCC 38755 / EP155) TaxID=660469 RepID=A0A9P5CN90_CRYP1|nr:DUF1338-domain-containing protein [Cryphonectria parasitica EP155]KAF3765199.1 DUF1338-domain-containing protein [Cryphonectria parasitica EP155]
MPSLVSATQLRLRFARALSRMYQQEVPQYAVLQRLVDQVNTQNRATLPLTDIPRHGAVRLASTAELHMAARFFNILGMKAVGHYNLSATHLPIHATAFRPVTQAGLSAAPFRLFTSVLRTELLSPALQPLAESLLAQRSPVFSQRTVELVEAAESQGGLTASESEEFIQGGCETLAWRNQVSITRHEYDTLKADSNGDLLVDIMAFRNPHLNHLTPATVAIDDVQQRMPGVGLVPKDRIEGPPERKCNILLRQTSFLAVDEGILFSEIDGNELKGSHCARFGEVEQRGAALTLKGRKIYDEMITKVNRLGLLQAGKESEYKTVFDNAFPDDWEALRAEGLIWAEYSLTEKGQTLATSGKPREAVAAPRTLQQAISHGLVSWAPIQYEDFLPLSAAGIFQSNLHQDPSSIKEVTDTENATAESKRQLQQVLGGEGMLDEMELYRAQEMRSIEEVCAALDLTE